MYFNVTYGHHCIGDRVKEYLDVITPHLPRGIRDNIRTVLAEGLSNAIRANERRNGTEITVAWYDTGGLLRLEISDHGGGFEYHLERPMPSPDALSGRGIPIMQLCCDKLFYLLTEDGVRLHALWNL